MEIDTMNKFMVAATHSQVLIMRPPQQALTPNDALLLAAYLVSMAEPWATVSFSEVLDAVQST